MEVDLYPWGHIYVYLSLCWKHALTKNPKSCINNRDPGNLIAVITSDWLPQWLVSVSLLNEEEDALHFTLLVGEEDIYKQLRKK